MKRQGHWRPRQWAKQGCCHSEDLDLSIEMIIFESKFLRLFKREAAGLATKNWFELKIELP
jgi:hypothetical protein